MLRIPRPVDDECTITSFDIMSKERMIHRRMGRPHGLSNLHDLAQPYLYACSEAIHLHFQAHQNHTLSSHSSSCSDWKSMNAVLERNHVTLRWLDLCFDADKLLLPVSSEHVECQPLPYPLPLPGMDAIRCDPSLPQLHLPHDHIFIRDARPLLCRQACLHSCIDRRKKRLSAHGYTALKNCVRVEIQFA